MLRWARAALLFCTFAVAAQAQQFPIVELTEEGSQRYPAEDILAYSGLKVDKSVPVTLRAVEEAAQRLVSSGAFDYVKYEHVKAPGGMAVKFTVTDHGDDQFLPVDFENIVWFSAAALREELHRRVPLFAEKTALGGDLSNELAAAVQAMLAEKGIKGHVSAGLVAHPDPKDNAVQMVLDDVQILIAEVRTPGVPDDLAKPFTDETRKLVGVPFRRDSVEEFVNYNLKRVLLKQGRLRASFGELSPEVLSNEAGITRVRVTVPVLPGLPYKFAGAKWEGSPFLSPDKLDTYLHAKPGQAVDGAQLNDDLTRVRVQHLMRGYMQARVKKDPEFDDAAGTVRYTIRIEAGDLYTMGKFEVEGFKPEVVEQLHLAWKLREGDPFDDSYLKGFLKTLHIPGVTDFAVEKSEGEAPHTMDVTIVACLPGSNCKVKSPELGEKDPQ